MVTVYKLVCKNCGYKYPTPVGRMDDLPEVCTECGESSFQMDSEDLEVDNEVEYMRNKTDFSDLDVWELEDYEQERSHHRR